MLLDCKRYAFENVVLEYYQHTVSVSLVYLLCIFSVCIVYLFYVKIFDKPFIYLGFSKY